MSSSSVNIAVDNYLSFALPRRGTARRVRHLYHHSTPSTVQAANDAALALEQADEALRKALKGPIVRDEAAITAALDSLDAALLAVSVAARKAAAAAANDGAGEAYDAHADAMNAINRVFDLIN